MDELNKYPSQPTKNPQYVITLPEDFKVGTPIYLDVFGWVRTHEGALAVGTWRKTS